MVDITRLRKNAEKKQVSVAVAEVRHGDVSATTLQELFNLPPNCLIIDSGCIVEVAGQASLTVDLGFAGGSELGNDLDIDAAGYVEGLPQALDGNAGTLLKVPRILTGTGKNVTAKFSADPSAGIFHFYVMFVDYTRGNGELMNYTA